MNKVILCALSLFVFGSVIAKPFPFFSKTLQSIKPTQKVAKHDSASFQYTDFTGHWKSLCEAMEDFSIENNEDSISVDGEELLISAVNHQGFYGEKGSGGEDMLLEWIEQGQTLRVSSTGYLVGATYSKGNDRNDFFTFVSEGKMTLKEGHLVMRMNTTLFINGERRNVDAQTCTFEKQ